MTWDHPRGKGPLLALGGRSGSAGTTVVEWAVRSLQAFADAPLDELARQYELLVIDHPHIPLVAGAGLLVPFDGCGRDDELAALAAQSVGASYSSYVYEGRVWALPIDAAAQVAVYRPDLLSTPPETWDEVLSLAADGRVLWPTKPVDAMSSFLTLVGQRGGSVCTAPDHFVSRELGLEVLSFMVALSDLVEPACREENPIETAERLACGDQWYYAPLAFGYVNYSRQGFRPHRLAYRDVPRGPLGIAGVCLGGAGIAVSSRAALRDAAIDVAFWLASASLQREEYYAYGGQPANAVAWDDPEVNADSLDFFRNTRATLEAASVRPREPVWLELQEMLGDLVHATLWHRLRPGECLERLDGAWRSAQACAGDAGR